MDYDALAAALLRAGLNTNVGVDANDAKLSVVGLSESDVKGGLGAAKSDPGERKVNDGIESWADAMQELSSAGKDSDGGSGESVSDGSVEVVGSGVVSDKTRESVRFGGFGDGISGVVPTTAAPGFHKTVVRNARAKDLRVYVERIMEVKLPKEAHAELGLCTFAAGCMPDVAYGGKAKLRTLAAVGDAALTLHLVVSVWAKAGTAESAQRVRTSSSSNAALCALMTKTGMVDFVAFPPGVDPANTVASATAFEAVLGVLTLYMPHECVRKFLSGVGALK